MKSCFSRGEFTKEIERIDEQRTCKVQNNDVCSFYIGDCLHVTLLRGYFCKIYLLHKSSENKKLDLPQGKAIKLDNICLLYTSPSPRDKRQSRMPSSA